MNREVQVRISEGVGVGFPRATRLSAGLPKRQRGAPLDRSISWKQLPSLAASLKAIQSKTSRLSGSRKQPNVKIHATSAQ
jgi:hypothetical protein